MDNLWTPPQRKTKPIGDESWHLSPLHNINELISQEEKMKTKGYKIQEKQRSIILTYLLAKNAEERSDELEATIRLIELSSHFK